MSQPELITRYFTFGQGQAHRHGRHTLDHNVVVVITDSDPRERMCRDFGQEWSMEYQELPKSIHGYKFLYHIPECRLEPLPELASEPREARRPKFVVMNCVGQIGVMDRNGEQIATLQNNLLCEWAERATRLGYDVDGIVVEGVHDMITLRQLRDGTFTIIPSRKS